MVKLEAVSAVHHRLFTVYERLETVLGYEDEAFREASAIPGFFSSDVGNDVRKTLPSLSSILGPT